MSSMGTPSRWPITAAPRSGSSASTPQTVSPSVPNECGGVAATNTARSLLEGKSVELRFDPTQDRRDTYGRLLAYLTLPGIGDYGPAMLKRGRAAELTYDGAYRLQDRYQSVEASAMQADRNMWRAAADLTDRSTHHPTRTEASPRRAREQLWLRVRPLHPRLPARPRLRRRGRPHHRDRK